MRKTRNNGYLITLPKMKLEYGRRSLKYMRAKIFDELPIKIREKYQDNDFKNILKNFFDNV